MVTAAKTDVISGSAKLPLVFHFVSFAAAYVNCFEHSCLYQHRIAANENAVHSPAAIKCCSCICDPASTESGHFCRAGLTRLKSETRGTGA